MQKLRKSKTINLFTALLIMALAACSASGDARKAASEIENEDPQQTAANSFDDPSTHTPQPPGRDQAVTHSQVFVDSAWLTEYGTRRFVHIAGHLPTPCHRLDETKIIVGEGKAAIELRSWQAEGFACVQVLQPFVYLHEITAWKEVEAAHISVNGTPLSKAP